MNLVLDELLNYYLKLEVKVEIIQNQRILLQISEEELV